MRIPRIRLSASRRIGATLPSRKYVCQQEMDSFSSVCGYGPTPLDAYMDMYETLIILAKAGRNNANI